MNAQRRAARRRVRLWMRLNQRCGGMRACGAGDRRGWRWWTRDWDLLSAIDPAVREERHRLILEQAASDESVLRGSLACT